MAQRIGIFGASGFVGSALIERLFVDGEHDFVAFIHSVGNAAGIARFPIEIETVDVLDADRVHKLVGTCDAVINCSRGPSTVMLQGLSHMIQAARKTKLQRFIHVSSVSIYRPDANLPPVVQESEPTQPDPGYGELKLKQDEMVLKLHRAGVPSIILCPSNIYGPYSLYIAGLMEKLKAGQAALVDGGAHAVNLVHVYNLVEAMLASLKSDAGWGKRYFVNDPNPPTWHRFLTDLHTWTGSEATLRSLDRDEALRLVNKKQPPKTSSSTLKTLVSGEFREALSMLPLFRRMNDLASGVFNRLNPEVQSRLRSRLEKPVRLEPASDRRPLSPETLRAQIRQHYFSPENLNQAVGYEPLLDYAQGMETVESWLRFARIIESRTIG